MTQAHEIRKVEISSPLKQANRPSENQEKQKNYLQKSEDQKFKITKCKVKNMINEGERESSKVGK